MTQVRVEFFGIPRARAGVAETLAAGDSLGELVLHLSQRFPQLAESCFDGPQFRPGYTANLGGDKFTTEPTTPLQENESILILSLDAGG